jgi:hypothetical protein
MPTFSSAAACRRFSGVRCCLTTDIREPIPASQKREQAPALQINEQKVNYEAEWDHTGFLLCGKAPAAEGGRYKSEEPENNAGVHARSGLVLLGSD